MAAGWSNGQQTFLRGFVSRWEDIKKHPRIPGFPDSEVAEIQEVLDTHAAESNEDGLEQIPPKR